MPRADTRQLSAVQAQEFDQEYVDDATLARILSILSVDPSAPLRILDVGGGNGVFLDKLLAALPNASGVIVEPDAGLSARNRPGERKVLLHATFKEARSSIGNGYDLVFFNWVLHHFVMDSYWQTVAEQRDALRQAAGLLGQDGRIVVCENCYDGWFLNDLPGWLIHALTSSTLLAKAARRLGANTAGVGVCFHSLAAWQAIAERAGLVIDLVVPLYRFGALGAGAKVLLHMRNPYVSLLVLRPGSAPRTAFVGQ